MYLCIIGLVQTVFICTYLFLKKNKPPACKFAVFFIICVSFNLILTVCEKNNFYPELLIIHAFRHSIALIYGPLLYFYTKSVLNEQKNIDIKSRIHFYPFISVFILLLSGMRAISPGEIPKNLKSATIFFTDYIHLEWILIFILTNILILGYTVKILLKLNKHKKKNSKKNTFDLPTINLNWLKYIIIVFIFSTVFTSLFVVISPIYFGEKVFDPETVISFGTIFFIFAFSIFINNHQDISTKNKDIEYRKELSKKYERSGLKSEDKEMYLAMIENYMQTEKPFLDCELTIEYISSELDIKRHYITQILNEQLNVNFNTYINNLRIEYTKERMKADQSSESSLLEIALESGFNSKTTFNRVFKAFTGVTPSSYKRTITKTIFRSNYKS